MKSKPPAKPRAIELLLSPINNHQLANLCGALDENLRQIETALDVSIARRGERFTLRGERPGHARPADPDVIEGEYSVVEKARLPR